MYLGNCMSCSKDELQLAAVQDHEDAVNKDLAESLEYANQGGSTFPLTLSDLDMVIICGNCGAIDGYIEKYKPEFRPENQKLVEGIPFNPKLRYYFDNLANTLRPVLEQQDWFDRPYIVTCDYSDIQSDHSYSDYVARMKSNGSAYDNKSTWDQAQASQKASWYNSFPSGTRYEVRCLDGGAWDRSSGWGFAATLEEAISITNSGPTWRKSVESK